MRAAIQKIHQIDESPATIGLAGATEEIRSRTLALVSRISGQKRLTFRTEDSGQMRVQVGDDGYEIPEGE